MLTAVTAGVHVEGDDARAVVYVSGEIDIATTPVVDDAVASINAPNIVLDLAEVSFMGSSGLATLLRAARRAEELGGTLVLRSPSRAVRDLLDMTHLTSRFTIE